MRIPLPSNGLSLYSKIHNSNSAVTIELAPLTSSTRLVTRRKRSIQSRLCPLRYGLRHSRTVRLVLHSSRAVRPVTVGAIMAPWYGGGHVTGFVGVDSKSSTRFPPPRPREPEGTPVRRRLRDTDRGPDGSRRPLSVVPAGALPEERPGRGAVVSWHDVRARLDD
jgi:hypothetical protein